MKMKIAREIGKMSKCCRWLLVLVMIMNTGEMWGYWEGSGQGQLVNGTYYALYNKSGSLEYHIWGPDDPIEYSLQCPGDKLYFGASKTRSGIGPLKIDQYVNNSYSNLFNTNPANTVETNWLGRITNYNYRSYEEDINVDATKIKFYIEFGASLTKYFGNVNVTMAKYCAVKETTVDFGDGDYLNEGTKTLKIYWSNMADVTISKTDAADQFTISKTSVGCSAGYYGNTIITITYKRTKQGTHNATLTINGQTITLKGRTNAVDVEIRTLPTASEIPAESKISNSTITPGVAYRKGTNTVVDGTWTWTNPERNAYCDGEYNVTFTPAAKYNGGYNSATCNISIPITRIDQSITWNDAEGQLDGDVSFNANAKSQVHYRSSDESVATMSGNTIHWHRTGQVTITAYTDVTADGNCNYNDAAESISKTFYLTQDLPEVVTAPTASDVVYGDLLSTSVLSGGVVKYQGITITGTWTWVNGNILPQSTGPQQAMFTPDDVSYAKVSANVTVAVVNRNPILTWQAGVRVTDTRYILRENGNFYNPVVSTNKETQVQIDCNGNSLLSFDAVNNRLHVGQITDENVQSVELTVYVSQTAGTHFNAYPRTAYTLVILKKSALCLDMAEDGGNYYAHFPDETAFRNSRVSGTNEHWCGTNEQGLREDYIAGIDVKYTQKVGIALGTWEDGFTGIFDNFTPVAILELISGTRQFSYSSKQVDLSFTGVPSSISFTTSTQTVTTIGAILGTPANFTATLANWELLESADNSNWTHVTAWQDADNINVNLKPDTRYIRIKYTGNFAGFVENLKIHRRHGFEVKNSSGEWVAVTETTLPQFGVNDGNGNIRPLQIPQRLPIRYYSIGDCSDSDSRISVVTTDGADYFYADVEEIGHDKILNNVDIDQWGEETLTIRNTGIGQDGKILLTGSDGKQLTINVSSATPNIYPVSRHLFHTGTEQQYKTADDPYRGLREYEFSLAFDNDGTPLFDTLFVFGVTGNTERVSEKFDYYDINKGYWLPKVNKPTEAVPCNAHTPMFVYKKGSSTNPNEKIYSWVRTVKNVSATGLQGMRAHGQKLAFAGYCPYAYTGVDDKQDGFVYFTSDGVTTDITLVNTEIGARPHTADGTTAEAGYENPVQKELHEGDNGVSGNGALFAFRKTSNNGLPYNVNFHIWGANTLRSTRGTNVNVRYGNQTLQMHQSSAPISVNTSSTDSCVNITINDMYDGVHTVESSLTLISSEKTGVIDIGNEKSTLTVNGGIVNMVNGNKPESPLAISYQRTLLEDENGRVAILYGSGTDQTDAHVNLNDGTMMAEEEIRMPWNTVVTGGTYLKDINCYEKLKTGSEAAIIGRPTDGEGREVNRVAEGMFQSELPAGYGHESVVADEQAKVYPLLPGERRENSVNPWVAAMPENEAEAAVRNGNLLYMEVADGLFDSSDRYKTVVSSADYSIDGKMSMLIQVDRADRWRTMVAPFDVKRVYVLELAQEEGLKYKKDRATLIAKNKAAAEELHDYLKPYVAPSASGSATLLPLRALLSKYMAEHKNTGEGISPIKHYDGTNYNEANYYLYQVKEPSLWEIEDAQAKAQWDYVTAKADGTEVIMQQGHTYSMSFTYCPTCDDEYHESRYDYWTGKLILLEGDGGQLQSASGAETALENSKNRADATHVVLTGNSSLGSMSTTGVYRFNPLTDKYEKASGEVVLSPTESVMYASGSLRAAAIHRSGRIEYAEEGSDSGNEGGITTETDSMHADEVNSVQKVMQNGTIYIIREGNTYTVTGQRVK